MKKLTIILLVLLVLDIIFARYSWSLKITPPKSSPYQGEDRGGVIIKPKTKPKIKQKILLISEKYLGVQYKANTLIGGPNTPEQLVINKQEIDCFTFLDYVLAEAFEKPVQEIRYKNSQIGFETRNHYFTQWINNNQKYLFNPIRDNCATKSFDKANQEIAKVCWTDNLSKLENGDFVGFYSEKENLDVSHVGIIVFKNNEVWLRHASPKAGKVIDEKLEPRKLVIARAFKELVEPKIKTDLQYIKYGSPDKCLLHQEVALMIEKEQ